MIRNNGEVRGVSSWVIEKKIRFGTQARNIFNTSSIFHLLCAPATAASAYHMISSSLTAFYQYLCRMKKSGKGNRLLQEVELMNLIIQHKNIANRLTKWYKGRVYTV